MSQNGFFMAYKLWKKNGKFISNHFLVVYQQGIHIPWHTHTLTLEIGENAIPWILHKNSFLFALETRSNFSWVQTIGVACQSMENIGNYMDTILRHHFSAYYTRIALMKSEHEIRSNVNVYTEYQTGDGKFNSKYFWLYIFYFYLSN